MADRDSHPLIVKDVQLRADGSEAQIIWLTYGEEVTMVVPARTLVKLMRNVIEIVNALHSQTAVARNEILDPRDLKPMPDYHVVADFGLIESAQSRQFELWVKSSLNAEVLLHFAPEMYGRLLAHLQSRRERLRDKPPAAPGDARK